MTNTSFHKQLKDFNVFPKHVGTWSGYWIRMDANAKETASFEAVLEQKIADNQWVQTNTYKYPDGRTVTNNFIGKVISNDEVEIEALNVPQWQNFRTVAREHGDSIIIFNVWDKTTGKLLATEMINLVNYNNRCRTNHSFTEEGKLKGLTLIVEERIS
jgi:hypothetical protein